MITDKDAKKLRSKTPQPKGIQAKRDSRAAALKEGEEEEDEDYMSDTPSESSGTPNASQLDSSDFDSDEGRDNMENQHGFLYGHNLDTYKKSKKERNIE